jgi:hypothetical protein
VLDQPSLRWLGKRMKISAAAGRSKPPEQAYDGQCESSMCPRSKGLLVSINCWRTIMCFTKKSCTFRLHGNARYPFSMVRVSSSQSHFCLVYRCTNYFFFFLRLCFDCAQPEHPSVLANGLAVVRLPGFRCWQVYYEISYVVVSNSHHSLTVTKVLPLFTCHSPSTFRHFFFTSEQCRFNPIK